MTCVMMDKEQNPRGTRFRDRWSANWPTKKFMKIISLDAAK